MRRDDYIGMCLLKYTDRQKKIKRKVTVKYQLNFTLWKGMVHYKASVLRNQSCDCLVSMLVAL